MSLVEQIYNEKKLLVRAMDGPRPSRNGIDLEYDCTPWANEFNLLSNSKLSSASTTLIVPDVGVSTYKSMGFLINSDLANCFHISISDSVSSGDIEEGDFFASDSDFDSIEGLANFIEDNNATTMNEVNVVASIDSVLGLFINKCGRQQYLLSQAFVIQKFLKHMLNIEYPIYSYDSSCGSIEKIELTDELQNEIMSGLKAKRFFYWPDDFAAPVSESLDNIKPKSL